MANAAKTPSIMYQKGAKLGLEIITKRSSKKTSRGELLEHLKDRLIMNDKVITLAD